MIKWLFHSINLLALTACASGSIIVTGSPRPPIQKSEVRIYHAPPEKYQVIALVKASSANAWTQQGRVDYVISELKSQAAKVGANGLILRNQETISKVNAATMVGGTAAVSNYDTEAMSATAVYVIAE